MGTDQEPSIYLCDLRGKTLFFCCGLKFFFALIVSHRVKNQDAKVLPRIEMVSLENEHIKNISEGAGFKFLSSFSIEIHPGVHFIKLRHFKCQNMGILNAKIWACC